MHDYEKTEVLDLNEIKRDKKRESSKKNKFFFRTLPLIMMPILFVLTIISTHSTKLVIIPINYIVYVLLSLFIYLFVISFFISPPCSFVVYLESFEGIPSTL